MSITFKRAALRARLAFASLSAALLGTTALGQGSPPTLWAAAGHSAAITALDLSPDGALLASSSADKTVKLWRYPEGHLLHTLVVPYDINAQVTEITGVRCTPDGGFVAVAMNHYNATTQGYYGKLRLFRVNDGALIRSFDGHGVGVSSVDVAPNGIWLASAGQDNGVKVWRIADGALLQSLTQHAGPAADVRFAPAGDRLCAAFYDRHLVAWSTNDWSVQWDIVAHNDTIGQAVFSSDGSRIATVSLDGAAKTFRATDGALQRTFAVGSGLYAVAFSPDGQSLATGGFDNTIRLSDVASGNLERGFADGGGYVLSLRYTADGARLLSGGGYPAPRVHVWNPADGSLVRALTEHSAMLSKVAFSADSTLIATAAPFDRKVRVFAAASGQLLYAWNTDAEADDVAFSPDNQLAALPGVNHTVVIRRLSDGAVVRTLSGHAEDVTGVAFSHDGALLATGSYFPGSVRLWRTADWSLVREIPNNPVFGPFVAFTFSPNDTLLGAVAEGAPVVFRVADGARVATPSGISNAVTFSPDGTLFAASGGVYQNQVRIYSASNWTLLHTLPTGANSVAFTPDGQQLYVAHLDALRIWRTSDWTVLRTYDQELGYTGSTESVQSLAVAPNAARFAYGRTDATLVTCANPFADRAGDLDCDGRVDFADINPFVQILTDPAGWQADHPDCPAANGDTNGDGSADFSDINPFVALLGH